MNSLVPVVLCSIALSAQALVLEVPAYVPGIDLDKPGALEALERDNPMHYVAVMKKVEEVQTPPVVLNGLRDLRFDFQNPFGTGGRLVEPMYPAKSRIGVDVDGTTYLITVRYTKDPAVGVPAK